MRLASRHDERVAKRAAQPRWIASVDGDGATGASSVRNAIFDGSERLRKAKVDWQNAAESRNARTAVPASQALWGMIADAIYDGQSGTSRKDGGGTGLVRCSRPWTFALVDQKPVLARTWWNLFDRLNVREEVSDGEANDAALFGLLVDPEREEQARCSLPFIGC